MIFLQHCSKNEYFVLTYSTNYVHWIFILASLLCRIKNTLCACVCVYVITIGGWMFTTLQLKKTKCYKNTKKEKHNINAREITGQRKNVYKILSSVEFILNFNEIMMMTIRQPLVFYILYCILQKAVNITGKLWNANALTHSLTYLFIHFLLCVCLNEMVQPAFYLFNKFLLCVSLWCIIILLSSYYYY